MLRKIALVAAIALPVQAAQAQQGEDDLRVRVGLGAQWQPEFVGANGHEIAVLPNLDIKRGNEPFDFEAPDDNFGIAVIKKNGFSFGPSLNIQSGRKNKDVGAPVGRIKTTVELGGFVQYEVNDGFRLRGEVRQGVNGHEGMVASLGADKIWRDGDRYVFSVGPRANFSNAKYQRAWFGVTPEVALLTGLPTYRPGAGFHSIGAASGMKMQVSGPFGVFGYAKYERLMGDAGKSPIIRDYGSRNQTSAGLGLTYTFNVKR